jgi:hypothetical protein
LVYIKKDFQKADALSPMAVPPNLPTIPEALQFESDRHFKWDPNHLHLIASGYRETIKVIGIHLQIFRS